MLAFEADNDKSSIIYVFLKKLRIIMIIRRASKKVTIKIKIKIVNRQN